LRSCRCRNKAEIGDAVDADDEVADDDGVGGGGVGGLAEGVLVAGVGLNGVRVVAPGTTFGARVARPHTNESNLNTRRIRD
jgi:hypothetical protein